MNPAALKETFDHDGFVIIPGFLSHDEVAEMRERTARYLAEVLPSLPEASRYGGTLKGLDRRDPWFRNYLEHGKQVPLLETLIADALAPDGVIWNDKPPGRSIPTRPHQDAIGSPRVPPGGCSMWVALDRVDRETGCLYYACGSHRRGLIRAYPIPASELVAYDPIPAELLPGDAVVHNALTIHWANENLTDRSRRSVTSVYWAASSAIDPIKARKFASAYGASR
jgi:phytanoyl-CoA hydroxylase